MRISRLMALAACLVTISCSGVDRSDPEPGVSLSLAEFRAGAISDLRYDVHFDIPEQRDSAVTGTVRVRFVLRDSTAPLVLDFRAPPSHVTRVLVDGARTRYRLVPDHIVVPAGALRLGEHVMTVDFRSTDAALNRNDEYLYALFVPDRASTAFPVFEQPDLKARYTASLTIPSSWNALSNGALVGRDSSVGMIAVTGGSSGPAIRHTVRFAETEPLSTYLFTFAAGRFSEERAVRGGREYTMFHRETDTLRIQRNREAIFDLHAASVRWLEDYTGIAYPFGKFAFLAVPSFQFGGMEHPGAVWYRSSSLFLDESPSRTQELGRASLIAHETAHMWFGDLVTMRWFNDVWMKEVFANFMAAKIAEPSFPDIDHEVRFFQAHHPSAYGVDRTAGANAIRQELENLREAGSLYGAIIYQKAPIVMRQLEALIGESTFRDGLRRYLAEHKYANATWPDLIAILDGLSSEDVTAWSRAWVEEPGRPRITVRWTGSGFTVRQSDPFGEIAAPSLPAPVDVERRVLARRDVRWTQRFDLVAAWGQTIVRGNVRISGDSVAVRFQPPASVPRGTRPDFVLAGTDGLGYARFPLDDSSRVALLGRVHGLAVPLMRAVAWQTLTEEMLDGLLTPQALLDAGLHALSVERDELIASQLLGIVRSTYWRFLTDSVRRANAAEVERVLWAALERAPNAGRKGSIFSTIISTTLTPGGVARLERIWRKSETPGGFPISEQQYIAIAEGLAIRGVPNAMAILDSQEVRITDPDRRERQRYMRAALSADVRVRDSLFQSFARVENRRRESWVLDAMSAMNHPLRAAAALPNLQASLLLTEEIQRTGDIFFPLRWLNAAMDGHQSPEAAALVERFLTEHPDYPPRLRGKMLQAADDLLRSQRVLRITNELKTTPSGV